MQRPTIPNRRRNRMIAILIAATAVWLAACDGSVDITGPTAPPFQPGRLGDRNLQISGSLTTVDGACMAATVLFDGRELDGARAECADASGCAALDLRAMTFADVGQHTISFLVLDQSSPVVEYLAEGRVRVSRDGLTLGGVSLPLGPKRASLQRGDSVTFEVSFQD